MRCDGKKWMLRLRCLRSIVFFFLVPSLLLSPPITVVVIVRALAQLKAKSQQWRYMKLDTTGWKYNKIIMEWIIVMDYDVDFFLVWAMRCDATCTANGHIGKYNETEMQSLVISTNNRTVMCAAHQHTTICISSLYEIVGCWVLNIWTRTSEQTTERRKSVHSVYRDSIWMIINFL